MSSELNIAIVGLGKVGCALGKALSQIDHVNLFLHNRTPSVAELLASKLQAQYLEDIRITSNIDLFIISIPDDNIKDVANFIRSHHPKAAIVHTSGSLDISQVNGLKCGLFYLLDSFGYEGDHDLKNTPIFIEAHSPELNHLLDQLAHQLSDQVYRFSKEERYTIHLAAVWLNNFSNAVVKKGLELLDHSSIDNSVLNKLLETTYRKIQVIGPEKAQTGPALRGDVNTIKQHLSHLKSKEDKESLFSTFNINK